MTVGVLAPAAVLGAIALVVVLFVQRGPTGVYQTLANALLATPQNLFRPGADALGGGIVSLPIWLLYLRLVVSEFRQAA